MSQHFGLFAAFTPIISSFSEPDHGSKFLNSRANLKSISLEKNLTQTGQVASKGNIVIGSYKTQKGLKPSWFPQRTQTIAFC